MTVLDLRRLLLFLTLFIGGVWGSLLLAFNASEPETPAITEAVAYLGDSPGPMGLGRIVLSETQLGGDADSERVRVTLPHGFREHWPTATHVVYEFEVSANLDNAGSGGENNAIANSSSDYAVFIPWIEGNARLFMNGVEFTSRIHGDRKVIESRYPILDRIPNGLFSDTEANKVQLIIEGEWPGEGFLAPVYFGEYRELFDYWSLIYFCKVTLVHILTLLMLTVILLSIFAHYKIRRDELYPWFIGLGFAWCMANEIFLIVNFPGPEKLRVFLFAIANLFTVTLLPIFAHRFMGLSISKWERRYLSLLPFEVAFVALWIIFDTENTAAVLEWTIRGKGLICILYTITRYYLYAFHKRTEIGLLPVLLLALAISSATFPMHNVFSLATGFSLVPANYLLVGSVFLLLVFVAIFLSRVSRVFRKQEELNKELDGKVQAAEIQIEKRYQELQKMQKTQAIAEERERIMADIHDGVAGQLATALVVAQRSEQIDQRLIDILRTSITDLRLVVDSLAASDRDINHLLGSFRDRVEPILSAANIELNWDVEIPDMKQLDSNQLLSLFRCLQEACTNAVRHADATVISIRGNDYDADFSELTVMDNGRGMPDKLKPGRGLANMKRRIDALGGSVAFLANTHDGHGVQLQFLLPKR